jgi:hypothetical protein
MFDVYIIFLIYLFIILAYPYIIEIYNFLPFRFLLCSYLINDSTIVGSNYYKSLIELLYLINDG